MKKHFWKTLRRPLIQALQRKPNKLRDFSENCSSVADGIKRVVSAKTANGNTLNKRAKLLIVLRLLNYRRRMHQRNCLLRSLSLAIPVALRLGVAWRRVSSNLFSKSPRQ